MAERKKKDGALLWWTLGAAGALLLLAGSASADDDGPIRVPGGGGDGPDGPGGEEPVGPIFPAFFEVDDPTPAQVDDLVRTYPAPRTYYQVKSGDTFTHETKGIATRMGLTALHLAAVNIGGLSVAEANAWAAARNKHATMRRPLTMLIACVPENDAEYGKANCSAQEVVAPNGRCISMLPRHADNRARIKAGESPLRTITFGGQKVSGSYTRFPFLWLPGIDLQHLWDTDGAEFRPGGTTWSDGSSTFRPPPLIRALGFQDLGNTNRTTWGCAPDEAQV